jgi:hypothetical protein
MNFVTPKAGVSICSKNRPKLVQHLSWTYAAQQSVTKFILTIVMSLILPKAAASSSFCSTNRPQVIFKTDYITFIDICGSLLSLLFEFNHRLEHGFGMMSFLRTSIWFRSCFVQLGFSMTLTHLSPVQYWFINRYRQVYIHNRVDEMPL